MPDATLPHVDIDDIIGRVGMAAFRRGQDYAKAGAVQDLAWNRDALELTGVVRGNRPHPYHCFIRLAVRRDGGFVTQDSDCSCPMAYDCKHVAATLLHSNARHVRALANFRIRPAGDQPATDQPAGEAGATAGVQPAWARSLAQLLEPEDASNSVQPPGLARAHRRASGRGGAEPRISPLGLQFELRVREAASSRHWGPPGFRSADVRGTGAQAEDPQHYRLGVRPVYLNAKGNWVRGNLAWNTISYQTAGLLVDPDQHRWFCQFAALHRATGQMYLGRDDAWLYLDDFASALLWNLFEDAARLGIALVGTRKDDAVVLGREATVTLDATAAREAGTGGGAGLRLSAEVRFDGVRCLPGTAGTIGDHGLYSWEPEPHLTLRLAPAARRLSEQERQLVRSEPVQVPPADVDRFMEDFYPLLQRTVALASSDGSVSFPDLAAPTLVLTLASRPDHVLDLAWDWEYRRGGTVARRSLLPQPGESVYRDTGAEAALLAAAARAQDLAEFSPARTVTGMDAAEFSQRALPRLEQLEGVRVDIIGDRPDYRELTEAPQLTVSTVDTEDADWFDLGVTVTVEGRTIPFDHIFRALSQGQKKLLLVDRTYLSLDRPELDQLRRLIDEAHALREWETGLRISRYQAGLWAELEELAGETEEAKAWRDSVTGLLQLESVEPVPVPAGLNASLRPYQREGFNWLAFLWRHRLGGVLADDMGLGKTLQTLALLCHRKETAPQDPETRKPFLVVAPTSVVPNWISECRRFAPGLVIAGITDTEARSARTARGQAGGALAAAAAGADVVVTSYTLFRLDFEAYQQQDWAGLVLDEAQFVKNRATRVNQCARNLKAPFKLAITGTPMENNLMELWSIFSIVAPGLFASSARFAEHYQRPIERNGDAELLARLRRRIRPLMMRRTKEEVAGDLPEKQEQVLEVELGPRHRKIYETHLQRERQKILGLIEDLDRNRFTVFRSLTLLRLLSLDASLIDDKYASVPSAKLDALFEQLEDVVAEGHRALVFSQFTGFLRKAAERLEARGIEHCYLDGSTRHRARVIESFKDGSAPVFLISLKAGGFGLNLTEADYCFLLDPWWNPATEAQAVDRAHRIGQTRNVMVYRLVSQGTIEEKVMALKERKSRLFSSVLDDDAMFSSALTAEDIRGLLENGS